MTYQPRAQTLCTICGEPSVARRLCRNHYTRLHKIGKLGAHPLLGPEDVFDNRIQKTEGCWLWLGSLNHYGYGVFMVPGGKTVRAHRYSYERTNGPIPDGMILLHSCDTPACVNPAHLKPGTRGDNIRDASQKGRTLSGERHQNARLTTAQVLAIRLDPRPNIPIAAEYGVNQSTISRIKSGARRRFE